MKFGICPVQWGSDLNRTEKEVLLAERLGYDQAWFYEHHGSPDSYLGVPLIVTSSLAGKTAHIHFGAFLPLLFYHPVRLAEEAAVIDRLSRGRLILALGQGYRSDEFSLFRVSRRGRVDHHQVCELELLLGVHVAVADVAQGGAHLLWRGHAGERRDRDGGRVWAVGGWSRLAKLRLTPTRVRRR